jgi:amino acid transporter
LKEGNVEKVDTVDKSLQLKKGALGTWEIAFFVISAAAPVYVVNVAFTNLAIGGIGAPLSYLGAGVFLLLFALGFTAMSKYVKNAGAFYAYVTKGMGKPMGAGAALTMLFSYLCIMIMNIGAFSYFAQTTFNDLLGINLSWKVWIFIFIAVVAFLGYRSVNLGAKILLFALTAECAIVLILSIAVLIQHPGGVSVGPYNPSHLFVPGIACLMVFGFGGFMGFESTVIYSEEARDPDVTIPRATYIAVGFLALFYSFAVWISTVAYGVNGIIAFVQSPNASNLYFDMSEKYLGHWAYVVMRILICTSILACQIGFNNAVSRYAFSLGREGLLPKSIGRSHPKYKSPYVANIAAALIMAVAGVVAIVAGWDPYVNLFVWFYAMGVPGIMIVMILVCVSVVSYFWRDRRGLSAFRTLYAPIIGGIGLTGAVVLIYMNFDLMTGYTSLLSNLAFMVGAFVVFGVGVLMAYRLKQTNPEKYELLAMVEY